MNDECDEDRMQKADGVTGMFLQVFFETRMIPPPRVYGNTISC